MSLKELGLKLQHKATFHHFRHSTWVKLYWDHNWLRPKPKVNTCLASCHCGWHDWMFRKMHWRRRFKSWFICSWKGHNWEDDSAETGPVLQNEETGEYYSAIDADELEDAYVIRFEFCDRCLSSRKHTGWQPMETK